MVFVKSALLGLALQFALAHAACNTYVAPLISGGFTQRQFIDFSGVSPGGDVASLLSANGIYISDYPISAGPVPRTFTPNNVAFGSGSLDMKVSAYTGSGSILSSEIATDDVFKYASVRTVLKSSGVPGVVEGNFFYLNDNQETDWEILTSTTLTSTPQVPAGIWASNQALVPGQPSTHSTVPFTFDPSQGYHEYRIDWAADATTFYIDGVQKARLTTNVPTQAGPWIWNSWSNGDPFWSNGPPTANSITHIRSIEIYKGYTSTRSGTICNI
ncbi:concanavalin A-like lectin/glucanase domain-containing protein [Lyophyllum atratum]|nr:concanavalin A-like lectin/glucanase domain-containing protein [Lyophyllum atratum]